MSGPKPRPHLLLVLVDVSDAPPGGGSLQQPAVLVEIQSELELLEASQIHQFLLLFEPDHW